MRAHVALRRRDRLHRRLAIEPRPTRHAIFAQRGASISYTYGRSIVRTKKRTQVEEGQMKTLMRDYRKFIVGAGLLLAGMAGAQGCEGAGPEGLGAATETRTSALTGSL